MRAYTQTGNVRENFPTGSNVGGNVPGEMDGLEITLHVVSCTLEHVVPRHNALYDTLYLGIMYSRVRCT